MTWKQNPNIWLQKNVWFIFKRFQPLDSNLLKNVMLRRPKVCLSDALCGSLFFHCFFCSWYTGAKRLPRTPRTPRTPQAPRTPVKNTSAAQRCLNYASNPTTGNFPPECCRAPLKSWFFVRDDFWWNNKKKWCSHVIRLNFFIVLRGGNTFAWELELAKIKSRTCRNSKKSKVTTLHYMPFLGGEDDDYCFQFQSWWNYV